MLVLYLRIVCIEFRGTHARLNVIILHLIPLSQGLSLNMEISLSKWPVNPSDLPSIVPSLHW